MYISNVSVCVNVKKIVEMCAANMDNLKIEES